MLTVLRRLLLWSIVCAVSASPSFLIARGNWDERAMACGVALFILIYTVGTSTPWFNRFHNLPFVRRTLYIGYAVRMAVSLVYPFGWVGDMWCGMLSIQATRELGLAGNGFVGTLVTTCVQGTVLNAAVFVFMLLVYGIQRAVCTPPAGPGVGRGFEVVMSAPTSSSAASDGRSLRA